MLVSDCSGTDYTRGKCEWGGFRIQEKEKKKNAFGKSGAHAAKETV